MGVQTAVAAAGPSNAVVNGAAQPDDNDTLSKNLVDTMQAIFGKHPGYRTSTYTTPHSSPSKHQTHP